LFQQAIRKGYSFFVAYNTIKLKFVNALHFLKNSMPMQLIAIRGREEFVSLANKYKLSSYDRGFLMKSKVLKWFASD
jgi:hypothetical protein